MRRLLGCQGRVIRSPLGATRAPTPRVHLPQRPSIVPLPRQESRLCPPIQRRSAMRERFIAAIVLLMGVLAGGSLLAASAQVDDASTSGSATPASGDPAIGDRVKPSSSSRPTTSAVASLWIATRTAPSRAISRPCSAGQRPATPTPTSPSPPWARTPTASPASTRIRTSSTPWSKPWASPSPPQARPYRRQFPETTNRAAPPLRGGRGNHHMHPWNTRSPSPGVRMADTADAPRNAPDFATRS